MITLHHCPQTRSMRTLWILHELDVPFEVVEHPFDKSLRHPEFLSVSPAGRVPALEIDGTQMIETGAIAEYLCERFSPQTLGRPPGHTDRMEWLVWVHFAETISQHAAALTQQHVVLYEDHMRSPLIMKIEAARLAKCYAALETQLTDAGSDHLLASGFSAADICVGQAVYMARHFATLDSHPATARWFDRITDRPAFVKSLPNSANRLYARDFYPVWEG
ncbi:glutathione S-transferase family protein [uncultured Tateyamaria sp.]|uniref:glutathione S-transferase family protein n=1 Tax=uncultured Tateyamaria sp. TaxID=455651 RepID=UPI0026126625|nr:glutathione S-transferase family protein [uncultured Tateyamaria sp.]